MAEIITKEEVERFKKEAKDVQMRGSSFIQDLKFILDNEGSEALKKIENIVQESGYPLDYKKINPKKFYPIWIGTLIFVAAERMLKYDDKNFEEMGRYNAETNPLQRFLLRHMTSIGRAGNLVSDGWRKYFTAGELENPEYSMEKKYSILRLYGFPARKSFCSLLRGYFSAVCEIIVGKKVTCEETKCTNRGDDYHEFKLTW